MGNWAPLFAEVSAKLGSGLATVLNIKDIRIFPDKIDLNAIGVAWDAGQGGWAAATAKIGQRTSTAINGTTSNTQELVAPAGIANAALNVANSGENFRVLGTYATVVFDAAGAAAFAGKKIRVAWSLFSVTDNFQVDCFGIDRTIAAADGIGIRMTPDVPYGAFTVPDTYRLRVSVISLDATNFPANTTWNTGVVGWAAPRNARVPL